jgi:hypothetical protein
MATDVLPTPPFYLYHCWDCSQSDLAIFEAHGSLTAAAVGQKVAVHDSSPHPVLSNLIIAMEKETQGTLSRGKSVKQLLTDL